MTPVERTARLLLLLLERPHDLDELRTLLDLSAAQLRRDLDDVIRAGWPVRDNGSRPKSVWIE